MCFHCCSVNTELTKDTTINAQQGTCREDITAISWKQKKDAGKHRNSLWGIKAIKFGLCNLIQ